MSVYPNEEVKLLTQIKNVVSNIPDGEYAFSGTIVTQDKYPNEECKLLDIIKQIFDGVEEAFPADTYKKVIGFTFDNNAYYEITGFKMQGSDTLRFSFKPTQATPACNVLGAYDGTSAQTNYSLYLGGSASAKYLRYNGSTYNSQAESDETYNVVITPTGSSGMKTNSTWDAKTFTSVNNLCIGTTSPSATSAKMIGDIIGNIVVDGRLKLVPCERISDNVLGYYDMVSKTFFEPTGEGVVSMGYLE